MDRRRFLLLGAATAAAGVAALGWVAAPVLSAKPGFDASDARLLTALAEDFYGPGGAALDLLPALEASLATIPESQRALLYALPALVERLAPLATPRIGPAILSGGWASLPPDDRAAAWGALAASDVPTLRAAACALRELILFHCYLLAPTWEAIGYPGPWVGRFPLIVHAPRFGALE